jgi:hypothetical protein
MTTQLLIVAILISLVSCKKSIEKQQATSNHIETKAFDLPKYAPLFKYKNLKTFGIDTLQFGKRYNFYNRVDSLTFEHIFQGHETFLYSNEYFFYAHFDNANKIALLEESDELGVLIWLISFDNFGKFIKKECLVRRE